MKRAALYMRVSTLDQHPETQLHDNSPDKPSQINGRISPIRLFHKVSLIERRHGPSR